MRSQIPAINRCRTPIDLAQCGNAGVGSELGRFGRVAAAQEIVGRGGAMPDTKKLYARGPVLGVPGEFENAGSRSVRKRIEAALVRNAEIEASRIWVDIDGDRVTLKGQVRTWFERSAAEEAARVIPGISQVTNEIAV